MSNSAAPNRLTNYAICIVSGALAGVVVAALSIGVELVFEIWYTPWSLDDYFTIEPIWQRVWNHVDGRFVGGAISGAIAGLFTGLFSRSTRRPYVLASVWASILGTVILVLCAIMYFLDFNPGQPAEIAVMIGVYLALGAMFGFTLGVISHLIEGKLERIRNRTSPSDLWRQD